MDPFSHQINPSAQFEYSYGSWQYVNHSSVAYIPSGFFQQNYQYCTHLHPSTYTYRWKPSNCNILLFNRTLMCSILHERSILFIGDSMSKQMAESLCWLMNATNAIFGPSNVTCTICNNLTVQFIRNSFLTLIRQYENNIQALPFVPFLELESTKQKFKIIMLNAGMHMTVNDRQYALNLNNTYNYFFNSSLYNSSYTILFRSTSPSHNTCTNYTGPLFFNSYSFSNYSYLSVSPLPYYKWEQIPIRNQIAYNLFKYNYLDIYGISWLRPDGHNGKDCAHWCAPGVPDAWNQLLMNYLIERS
jgi:hypothetical protein